MRRRYSIAVSVVAVAIVAAGSAVAATQFASPTAESEAIINDAAGRLHVAPRALSSALRQAVDDQIEAAVKAGRLTKQQGDALEAQIDSGRTPLVGGFGLGPGRRVVGGPGFGSDFRHRGWMLGPGVRGLFGVGLHAATSYLGVTPAQLRSELSSGKSLARIAEAHGKTADGLVAALVAAMKTRLDTAVTAKRLTSAQEKAILGRLKGFLRNLVNRTPFRLGIRRRSWMPSAGSHQSMRRSVLPTRPQP